MKKQFNYLIVIGAILSLKFYAMDAKAQESNWDNSSANWKNSQYNWDNSPSNWNNSPNNWNNTQSNWNSNNGVYDNQGKRLGYEVQSPAGVTNVFDNNGNRVGYVPGK